MYDSLLDRLDDKFTFDPDGCWRWRAARDSRGYGNFTVSGRTVKAHRAAYELFVGPIPEGLTLDHLCRNTSCVNPAHLEPVTQRENVLRGVGFVARQARQTHCVHGHEFTAENTYLRPDRCGSRECLTCRRNRYAVKAAA